jgi:hypothetical protein
MLKHARAAAGMAAALLIGLAGGTLVGPAVAAAPGDPCNAKYPATTSNGAKIDNLKAYQECRLDRLEAKLDALAPSPSATPSPTATSSTPSASATPTPTPTPTPSPTPTPTPPPTDSSCVKPTAANTGATGTRTASSVTALNTNGQVLEDVNVTSLTINAANVTVRNVQVNGRILVNRSADNATIERVTAKHIGFSSSLGTKVLNSRITNSTEDGWHITGDSGRRVEGVVLRGNLVDAPVPPSGAHYDGLQVRGANNLLVECNTINLGPYQDTFTAAVFLENANGGNTGVKVLNNWLDGGGYIIYPGGGEFSRNVFGSQARWGICYGGAQTGSGNTRADGTPVNLSAECG